MNTMLSDEPRLQVGDEVQDLRLNRDVESGGRLVEDNDARFRCERAGDRDALPLAAAEGVRIALPGVGREADEVEDFKRTFACGATGEADRPQRFGDDVSHPHARVERGNRILEDRLQMPPPQSHRALRQIGHILAEEHDAALRSREQFQHQPGKRAFPAATFPPRFRASRHCQATD